MIQANHTVIDGIFGGQLISTITCSQCHSVNQVFEGFLDLSLPIVEEKGVPPLLRGGCGEEKAYDGFLDVETQHRRPTSKHAEKKKKKAAKREAKKGEVVGEVPQNSFDVSHVQRGFMQALHCRAGSSYRGALGLMNDNPFITHFYNIF